ESIVLFGNALIWSFLHGGLVAPKPLRRRRKPRKNEPKQKSAVARDPFPIIRTGIDPGHLSAHTLNHADQLERNPTQRNQVFPRMGGRQKRERRKTNLLERILSGF